jgi:hypothetical protein
LNGRERVFLIWDVEVATTLLVDGEYPKIGYGDMVK